MGEFDKKIMTVKLSEVIAAVEKNLKSKTDFIKKIDLSNQIIYGDIVIISNEGQYFKFSEAEDVLMTKDNWRQRNSKLVRIEMFS